jgi:hypothetical protein
MYLNIYTLQKIPSDNTTPQPVKNFLTFYEKLIFVTMFRTHHLPYNKRVKTSSHNHNLFKNTSVPKLIYEAKCTNTKIYRHPKLVSLLNVSAGPMRHQQRVLSVVLVKLVYELI